MNENKLINSDNGIRIGQQANLCGSWFPVILHSHAYMWIALLAPLHSVSVCLYFWFRHSILTIQITAKFELCLLEGIFSLGLSS